MDSVLNSVKKSLGIPAEVTDFDPDVILFTNSAFGTLNQLGLGPAEGFEIEDATAVWDTFTLGNPKLNGVKEYVYISVRLVFDPPQQGPLLQALQNKLNELTWRLNVVREGTVYGQGVILDGVIDGGTP